jgi:formylglycine-generating enzyme
VSFWRFSAGTVIAGLVVLATVPVAEGRAGGCPAGMTLIVPPEDSPHGESYCIDRWEASLVEVTGRGATAPFSPYEMVKGRAVKAVSRSGVTPQAYISRDEAAVACKASKKRLCTEEEWTVACQGKRPTTFPYGDTARPGACNDSGTAPLPVLYPQNDEAAHSFEPMNDPRLNQQPNTVARTGSHRRCTNSYGVFDMVGNLHEWVDDPGGTFRGGYFLDTHINGDGCRYRTVAHDAAYHDYSTGFRCCADLTR